jgi:hypothetical protein
MKPAGEARRAPWRSSPWGNALLFEIERVINGNAAEQRVVRRELSAPLVAGLEARTAGSALAGVHVLP